MTKPPGAPPFQPHRRAYKNLLTDLWIANEAFRDEGDGGIEGAELACAAVVRFIGARHENPELAAPLFALRTALEDVRNGVLPDLFSVNPKGKERSRSSERKQAQFLIAVAVEVLIWAGVSVADASRQVVQQVREWGEFPRPGPSATTASNWRDSHRDRRHPHHEAFIKACVELQSRPDARRAVLEMLTSHPGVPGS